MIKKAKAIAQCIEKAAVTRLKAVDKALRDDGWNIDDGSVREKIKHTIAELGYWIEDLKGVVDRQEGFHLGDIVQIVGEYEGDWRDNPQVIVGMAYKRNEDTRVILFETRDLGHPTHGNTTDWDSSDFRLITRDQALRMMT